MTKETALELIRKKGDIYVNFAKRTCVYKFKETEEPIELELPEKIEWKEMIEKIEELYEIYYHSKTTTFDRRETYFYAKPFEELTDEELCFSEPRKVARATLELYILENILNGNFIWKFRQYFWQSKRFPELIIKRKWIKGE